MKSTGALYKLFYASLRSRQKEYTKKKINKKNHLSGLRQIKMLSLFNADDNAFGPSVFSRSKNEQISMVQLSGGSSRTRATDKLSWKRPLTK